MRTIPGFQRQMRAVRGRLERDRARRAVRQGRHRWRPRPDRRGPRRLHESAAASINELRAARVKQGRGPRLRGQIARPSQRKDDGRRPGLRPRALHVDGRRLPRRRRVGRDDAVAGVRGIV